MTWPWAWPGAASPGPFWAAADKKAGGHVLRPPALLRPRRHAARAAPSGAFFHLSMTCRPAHPFRAAPSGRSFPDRFRLVPGAHAAPSGRSFPNRFRLVPGAQARRAVWPLLPGPFPACVRRSRAPSGRSFPDRFRLVSGAHARRAAWPLLSGPFPACARCSGTPRRLAARRASAPFPEPHAPLTPGPAPARTPPAKRASGGRPGSAAFPRPKCL